MHVSRRRVLYKCCSAVKMEIARRHGMIVNAVPKGDDRRREVGIVLLSVSVHRANHSIGSIGEKIVAVVGTGGEWRGAGVRKFPRCLEVWRSGGFRFID